MSALDLTDLRAQLAPTLSALEAERVQQARTCSQAALWCAGLGLLGLAIAYGVGGGQLHVLMIVPPGVALMVYGFIAGNAKGEYSSGFKTMVMPQLVRGFGDLNYHAEAGLGEAEFNRANLYGRPDRYSCEDLIEGQIGATRLRMSEVHAEDEQKRTDSKGRTTTHYTTIFRGLFLIADFNKHFAGTTTITPQGFTLNLGGLGRGLESLGGTLSGRGALVQLEDPEFERAFSVHSSDQIEARYILSSALMSRFTRLKQTWQGDVSAAFIGGSLYLLIEKRDDWFEPPGLNVPLTFEGVESTLRQLQMATGLVEELDLNTRIWSKQ